MHTGGNYIEFEKYQIGGPLSVLDSDTRVEFEKDTQFRGYVPVHADGTFM